MIFQALVGGAYLRDGPLSRFQALIVKKPNLTWDDLRTDLLSAYEPANLASLNYIRLGDLTQVTCPTLADYVDKFTRLESQLPSLPESFKISIFVKNLKMELKEKIMANTPNTLEAVIALANSLDVNLLMCKDNAQSGFRSFNSFSQGNSQGKQHTQEVWCKYHKTNTHSSANCKNKSANQNNISKNDSQISNTDLSKSKKNIKIPILTLIIIVDFVKVRFVLKKTVTNYIVYLKISMFPIQKT